MMRSCWLWCSSTGIILDGKYHARILDSHKMTGLMRYSWLCRLYHEQFRLVFYGHELLGPTTNNEWEWVEGFTSCILRDRVFVYKLKLFLYNVF